MTYNPEIHHRRAIRLKGYDYSQPGAYFVTICVRDKHCLFGYVEQGEMELNNAVSQAVPIRYNSYKIPNELKETHMRGPARAMWMPHAFSKLRESRKLEPGAIAGLIDHTLLSPVATHGEIKTLCEEALHYRFFSVCVNPFFIKAAKDILKGSGVRVTTVIGFPLGMTLTEVKVYEATNALLLGADELDIVINLGALKSGDWSAVRKDISDVISATGGHIHKTIIETCYLTDEEKRRVVEIALDAGSEFIKTSTGFGPRGATVKDVRLIREIAGERAGVKAAGGIKTLKRALMMVRAGATRIGTSSGARIMKE